MPPPVASAVCTGAAGKGKDKKKGGVDQAELQAMMAAQMGRMGLAKPAAKPTAAQQSAAEKEAKEKEEMKRRMLAQMQEEEEEEEEV